MNGPIVWLASYPKSGNTWIRALLAGYCAPGSVSVDINQLGAGPIASSSETFEQLLGISPAELTPEEIARYRPGVHRLRAAGLTAPAFIKVHDAFTLEGESMFPVDVTAGVVYVVRNPLDVAASFASHSGSSIDTAIDRMCDEAFVLSKFKGSAPDQLPQRLGSWSAHAKSWIDESGIQCLVVRYEDLHKDAVHAFRTVVEFSGLVVDETRLAASVGAAAFHRLQSQELKAGFHERPPRATTPFFRRGVVAGWRSELSANQVARIVDAHGPTMERFGYLDGVKGLM